MILRAVLPSLLLLAAALPAGAEPFHHSAGEWREYHRDWLAACPDTINEEAEGYYFHSCFASTNSAERNSANLPVFQLTLIRNRLDGAVDIAITVADDARVVDEQRSMIVTFADGMRDVLDFEDDLETRHKTTNQFFVVDPATREVMLEEIKDGSRVTLSVPMEGELKPRHVDLSLNGAMASLDFMASYARRVGQY